MARWSSLGLLRRKPRPGARRRRGQDVECQGELPLAVPKSGALSGLRYSLMMLAALATGTTRASPRKRDEASSKSKHDDGSSRTSHNPHTRTAVGQSTPPLFFG